MKSRNQKGFLKGLVSLAGLSLLLLAACGEQANLTNPNYSEPLPDFHPGTYTMELSINDISLANLTYRPYLKFFVGHWVLDLKDTGDFEVHNDNLLFEGQYNLSSDEIIFWETNWLNRCLYSEKANEIAYKWYIYGKDVALISLEDGCFDRSLVLTAHRWVPTSDITESTISP